MLLTDPHAPAHPIAWIDTSLLVMNKGLDQSLDILDNDGKSIWSADLVEDGGPRDEDARKYKDTIPTWHGFSADGDVIGQLVYTNYGGKEVSLFISQQAELPDLYNRTMELQEFFKSLTLVTMISSLLRTTTLSYPVGTSSKPLIRSTRQRPIPFYIPGDPTTPGYPAYEDAERTSKENISKFPSLPISWQNAQRPFLKNW